jgi:hypothetical protein
LEKDNDIIWKALSDPTRRKILDLLRDGPRSTTEIVGNFRDDATCGDEAYGCASVGELDQYDEGFDDGWTEARELFESGSDTTDIRTLDGTVCGVVVEHVVADEG